MFTIKIFHPIRGMLLHTTNSTFPNQEKKERIKYLREKRKNEKKGINIPSLTFQQFSSPIFCQNSLIFQYAATKG